jgi:hypothetical protein
MSDGGDGDGKEKFITPAIIYVNTVIPAEAGIQNWTGCRIKSGMTIDMFNCRSNNSNVMQRDANGSYRSIKGGAHHAKRKKSP